MQSVILLVVLLSSASAFSLRSLILPISNALNTSSSQLAMQADPSEQSPFDISTCGRGKGCFLPGNCVPGATTNPCSMAFSFRPLDESSIEMELLAAVDADLNVEHFYVAVGFSDDDMMGDEPTTECSRMVNEPSPTIKASYNYFHHEEKKSGVDNRRIEGEENVRPTIFSSPEIRTVDGLAYCKFTQKIGGLGAMPMEYLTTTNDTPFYFLLAKGSTTKTDLKKHSKKNKGKAVSTLMKFSDTGSSASSFSLFVVVVIAVVRMMCD